MTDRITDEGTLLLAIAKIIIEDVENPDTPKVIRDYLKDVLAKTAITKDLLKLTK